jgi:hypothetical protein
MGYDPAHRVLVVAGDDLPVGLGGERAEDDERRGHGEQPGRRSMRCAPLDLRRPEDERERFRRTRPELAHDVFAGAAQDHAQRQPDDHGVVELPDHGDEVGHEVDRRRQICAGQCERDFGAARHARIAGEPSAEDEQVGDQPRQRLRLGALPDEREHEQHERPDRDDDRETDE